MFYQSHKELAFLIRRHLEVFNGQTRVKFLCSSAIPFARKRSLPVHTSRISKSPNSSVFFCFFLLLNAKPLDYLVELTADFGERLLFFLKVTHYLTKSSASVCRYHSISTAFVSHAVRKSVVKMNFVSRLQDRRFDGSFILLLILEHSSFIFTITHNL